MTTIHRTKGLEFDYVFIPSCVEGFMPCLYGTGVPTFDTTGKATDPEPSLAIENERRLFYVAVTRAIRAVYIGTSEPPRRGAAGQGRAVMPSRFLEEMRLAPTRALVEPLVGASSAELARNSPWFEAIRRHRGVRVITRNLVRYLTIMRAKDLARRVATVVDGVPEDPFTYALAYPDPSRPTQPALPPPPREVRVWDWV